jgi:hypothetical protein
MLGGLAGSCVGGARRCIDAVVLAAVEVHNLDLPPPRELNVVMDAVAVVLLHCLSLALIDPARDGL